MGAPHPLLVNIQSAWDKAKEFQVEDAHFAAANNSSVLGHETGLGKTFIAMMAWSLWPNARKGLMVGTLGSCATWSKLLQKWGGVKPTFLQGADGRWAQACAAKEGIWTCTYSSYLYMMRSIAKGKPRFDVVANDELHKSMRHRNQTWKAMKRLDFDHYLGLSATWASRGPQDLYPVLNLVNHRTFPSYWKFVNTWCHVEQSTFGTEIYGVKNLEQLRTMLWSRYYRKRTWVEVGHQFRKDGSKGINPVIRREEFVDMGVQQRKLIEDLERDMIAMLGDEMVVTPNSLALLTRKLQMAISPKILMPSAEYGGPVEWLANKIADDPHTVVFCPFREGLDVVRQKLIDDKRPDSDIFILRGGTHPEDVYRIIDAWKAAKGVLLCTTQFAQSFPADTTHTAYHLGFLWDPNDNYQADGRLRRGDSELETPCLSTYIVPEGSDYQHVVMDVLNDKVVSTRDYMIGYAQNVRRIKMKDIPMEQDPAGEDDDGT